MKSFSQNNLYFWVVIFVGLFARILISQQGYNWDFMSYRLVTDLFQNGEDFYITGRYNYAPIWINILSFLDSLPNFNIDLFDPLRIKVVLFLSFVDLFIFFLLRREHSFIIAAFFFLNPISIFISGFHNQFDNLAVLVGFIAILIYEKNNKNFGFFVCSLLLGISLCVKHVLFILPIWLAFKEKKFLKKVLIILIPYFIFLASFSFYIPEHFESIVKNVFQYSSFNNGPFWNIYMPYVVKFFISIKVLFIASLFLFGLFIKGRPLKDIFYLYLLAVVVFSSAASNQYFAIPLIAIVVFWNRFYAAYTFACVILFLVDESSLQIEWLVNIFDFNFTHSRYLYHVIIFILSIGFFETLFGKKRINKIFLKIYNIIKLVLLNLKEQFVINKK
jgi:hypothetical protein